MKKKKTLYLRIDEKLYEKLQKSKKKNCSMNEFVSELLSDFLFVFSQNEKTDNEKEIDFAFISTQLSRILEAQNSLNEYVINVFSSTKLSEDITYQDITSLSNAISSLRMETVQNLILIQKELKKEY